MGENPDETLHAFEKAQRSAIEDLRKKVARKMPFIGRVEITLPPQSGERKHPVISMSVSPPDRNAPGRTLTPVMARLDPRDVEVLDALFGPEGTGQRVIMSDVTQSPPRQPWWRRGQKASVWQSSWAGVSSLILGIFALTNIAGHTRGPWWLHLTIGVLFILCGLVNLGSALKLYRHRRRLADSATGDANPRL